METSSITAKRHRHRVVVDERPLAQAIGRRIRAARLRAGLTQQRVAEGRYTKAYISALENGIAKPSMAALNFLAGRLGVAATDLLTDPEERWARLEADLQLAEGDWQAALDGYDGLLERTIDQASRAEVQRARAEALARLERPMEALAAATEAARLFESLGRHADALTARYWMAFAHHALDNPDEARDILRGVLDDVRGGARITGDFEVRVLGALAAAATFTGDHRAALAYLEEARALDADLDDRRRGTLLFSTARSYRDAGDLEAAIRTGLQALGVLHSVSADRESAALRNELALSYVAQGNTTRASEFAGAARAEAERLEDRWLLSFIADTEARVAAAAGDLPAALARAEEAVGLADAAGNRRALLDALVTQATLLDRADRLDEADAVYQRAIAVGRDHASPARLRQVLTAWADALAARGRHDEAFAVAREALAAN